MLAPSGFRPTASGLIVPDEVSRVREVLTRDDWKVIDRAMKVLKSRGIAATMRCLTEGCTNVAVGHNDAGERVISCDHRHLVLANL